MKTYVYTWDGKEISAQRLHGKIRESVLRAGHEIGVLPDGRELVKFETAWVWLLKGASMENINEFEKIVKKSQAKK